MLLVDWPRSEPKSRSPVHFQIQFRSHRLLDFMFKSVDGKVEVIPSIYQTKGLIFDKALKPPVQSLALENPPLNPKGLG